MMYFEVFLEIVIAAFAVFGLFSLVELIGETYFRSDCLVLAVEVDSEQVARELSSYLKEAREAFVLRGNSEVLVVIKRELATAELLAWLERKRIRYLLKD